MKSLLNAIAVRIRLFLALVAAACLGFMPGVGLARERPLPRPVATQQVPALDRAHPALWKVSQGDTTIYLFGTVHALPAGVEWFDGPLATAFDASNTLVTEIIEKKPEDMRAIVVATAMLPQGPNLRDQLAPKLRAKFEKAMKDNGLPAEAFDRFQPWYAAVALSTLPLMHAGYDPANGVDARLTERAAKLGKAHEALETPEFQLGLFGNLSHPLQMQYLKEVVDGIATIPSDLKTMITEWKLGNAARLARIMNSNESDPQLTKLLLTNRNRNWAQWVKARLARPGTVFVAVGAGHLSGKGSLLAQLRAQHIAVTRVQ